MSKLAEFWDKIQQSEAVQQLRAKYDELDSQAKIYVNLGVFALIVITIFSSIVLWMMSLNDIKRQLEEKDTLIGYLHDMASQIQALKAKQSMESAQSYASLAAWVDRVIQNSGLDSSKFKVSAEKNTPYDKTLTEHFIEIEMTQLNLRQISRILYEFSHGESGLKINIKDLNMNTQADPTTGYIDAKLTLSAFKNTAGT